MTTCDPGWLRNPGRQECGIMTHQCGTWSLGVPRDRHAAVIPFRPASPIPIICGLFFDWHLSCY